MIRAVLPWAVAAASVAAVTLVARARNYCRHGRRFCPGPKPASWRWALCPWLAFRRSTCLYDLSGLSATTRGVRCPECGRLVTRPRQMRFVPGRWRAGEAVILGLVVASLVSRLHFFLCGEWASHLPGLGLVMLERAAGPSSPSSVLNEVENRMGRGELSQREIDMLIPRLIADLGSDRHERNAGRARWLLRQLYPASDRALNEALDSADEQRRCIAASVLRELCQGAPTDALLRQCAAELRSVHQPGAWRQSWMARESAEFLVQFPERAAPLIAPGLDSWDRQERFLCAAVAGFAGCAQLAPKAVPILLEHLRNNKKEGDAKLAAPALYHFGPAIVPMLRTLVNAPDSQQRGLVRLILHHLDHPGSPTPLKAEGLFIRGTSTDPITGVSIGDVDYWAIEP